MTWRKLTKEAKKWVDNFKPSKIPKYRIKKGLPLRSANLLNDRSLLESLAAQCTNQKVPFPNNVYVGQTPFANAWQLPIGNSYIFTEGIKKIETDGNPKLLDGIVAHEVAHTAQKTKHWMRGILQGGVFLIVFEGLNSLGKQIEKSEITISKKVAKVFSNSIFRLTIAHLVSSYVGAKFNQKKELNADKRAAKSTSPEIMINSLTHVAKINEPFELKIDNESSPKEWVKYISQKVIQPFPSHPSLEERVKYLKNLSNYQGLEK